MSKRITQETFDETVSENIEDFGMSRAEAVADAIQQFEAMGVDLSNIVKQAEEGSEPPVAAAISALSKSISEGQGIIPALDGLCQSIETNEDRVLASSLLAVGKIVDLCTGANGQTDLQVSCMKALSAVCKACPEASDNLRAENESGLRCILTAVGSAEEIVCTAGLDCLASALLKNEANRQTAYKMKVSESLMRAFERFSADSSILGPGCKCCRIMTFDDDMRQDFSNAHSHLQDLVEAGLMDFIVSWLVANSSLGTESVSEVLATLSKLLGKDEYVKKAQEKGVLNVLPGLLQASAADIKLFTNTALMMKTVCGNDDAKKEVAANGTLAQLADLFAAFYEGSAKAAEAGCGAIASATLRTPANAAMVVARPSLPEALAETLVKHADSDRTLRSACVCIRNLVSRNKDVVAPLLAAGLESRLRAVMEGNVKVSDYAKGALRDLGCDVAFREDWAGKGHKLAQGDEEEVRKRWEENSKHIMG